MRERGRSALDPTVDAPAHLEPEAFDKFLSERITTSGNRIVALQAFVPSRGEAGTAYVNSYEAAATKKGRPVTHTHRVRHWRSGGKHSEGKTAAVEGKGAGVESAGGSSLALSVASGGAAGGGGGAVQMMAPVRVRDQRLCGDLDATTRAVVDYLQRQHRLRVLTMKCEYVVDEESRVWFTWAWNVRTEKNNRKKRGGSGAGSGDEAADTVGRSLVEISQGGRIAFSPCGYISLTVHSRVAKRSLVWLNQACESQDRHR